MPLFASSSFPAPSVALVAGPGAGSPLREPQQRWPSGLGFVPRGRGRLERDAGEAAAGRAGTDPTGLIETLSALPDNA